MTTYQLRLGLDLIENHFDSTSKQITSYLNRKGPLQLGIIARDLKLSISTVSQCLSVLCIHDIVEYKQDDSNSKRVLYMFNVKRALYILHYAKCIHCAKQLYHGTGELIIEKLLLHGKRQMSQILADVYNTLSKVFKDSVSITSIRDCFQHLASAQFIQRVSTSNQESKQMSNMPIIVEEAPSTQYQVPELTQDEVKRLATTEPQPNKKFKSSNNTNSFGDENIFWKVNFQRFFDYLRDQELISAFTSRIDQNAGEIIRAILRLAETKPQPNSQRTIKLSTLDISKSLATTNPLSEDLIQKYMSVITGDVNNCVIKVDEQGKGSYIIDFQLASTGLTKAHAQSFLKERYGSNALRIYNMLEERGCLSQKQIEDMAMISAKEAQQYVYSMFIDGILSLEELSKANDFNPMRTFYFFRVNLYNVVLSLLEQCYKTMSNLMQRHTYETERHQKLIDKREKVDKIILDMREQSVAEEQIKEVEDILSPAEKDQIKKLDAAFRKIDLAQIQLTETILILEIYLTLSNSSVPISKKTGGKAIAAKLLENKTQD